MPPTWPATSRTRWPARTYLSRARLRTSAQRHARLLGYAVDEGVNARAFVALQATRDADGADRRHWSQGALILSRPPADASFGSLPAGLRPDPPLIAKLITAGVTAFETMEPVTSLRTARNAMVFHTWSGSKCCLPPPVRPWPTSWET